MIKETKNRTILFYFLYPYLMVNYSSYFSFLAWTYRGRGYLNPDDVFEGLVRLGFSLDSPSFLTVCESFDKNKKGMVRLDEFISLCIFVQSARYAYSCNCYELRV
ncbi:hypothetical protein BHE74_00055231 [Ensete ventricosum]|nr:hypothetical protein GW17_00024965 [Ensete ventricosum]RWW39443.1 hypothetical protein BHE74_00055231 [Ensete ventricosum]RZS26557.1 hypothetical protein BHM03_00059912 [Ensete ventricosum]